MKLGEMTDTTIFYQHMGPFISVALFNSKLSGQLIGFPQCQALRLIPLYLCWLNQICPQLKLMFWFYSGIASIHWKTGCFPCSSCGDIEWWNKREGGEISLPFCQFVWDPDHSGIARGKCSARPESVTGLIWKCVTLWWEGEADADRHHHGPPATELFQGLHHNPCDDDLLSA